MNLSNIFLPYRNQPLAVKALTRILANLEDQTGCVAHLLIASVNPGGGAPQIQKYASPVTTYMDYSNARLKVLSRVNSARVEV